MPFINDRLEEQGAFARAEDRGGLTTAQPTATRASRFKFDLSKVTSLLQKRIVGQPDVIGAMDDMLHVVKADIGVDHRPLSVTLFLGPTGVGKTETVRVIAEAILGSSDKICRVDMNTLMQEHYAAALTGAPPGYVGSKEGQTLFDIDAIQGSYSRPGIVLLDELEKASPEVIRSLLNVLDTGRLVLSSGAKSINFQNSMIFMISNVGAKAVAEYRQSFESGWRKWLGLKPDREDMVLDRALHKQFDPEFINRIDRIVLYRRLGAEWQDALFEIELSKLAKRLNKKGVSLTVTESAKDEFCNPDTGVYDERFGARDLSRRMRTELEPMLAKEMLASPADKTFLIDIDQSGKLVVMAQ